MLIKIMISYTSMKYTSFNKTKKPLRKGLTLIELVITIVIVGVLSLVIYPVINSSIDVYVRVQDSYDFSQDAIDFFAFLDTLFKDNCTVTAINSAQLGFTSDSENYQVAVSGFPGTPPYSITLTKNGGQARALVNGLAELSAPNRPGLEFVYFDHN